MTVAIHTEMASVWGAERAAQAAAGRPATSLSSRRLRPDGRQLQGPCPAGSKPDSGRMQGSALRGVITLAVQGQLPQEFTQKLTQNGDHQSALCEKGGLPERGSRGADGPVPAGIDAGGAPISIQCGITAPPVDNSRDFKRLASSSNSSGESAGTTRTRRGFDANSSSRSDGDTSRASASASRQQPAFRHACHPQSSQYGTPPTFMARASRT